MTKPQGSAFGRRVGGVLGRFGDRGQHVVDACISLKSAALGRPGTVSLTRPPGGGENEPRTLPDVSRHLRVGPPLPAVPPLDGEWIEPPSTGSGRPVASIYKLGARSPRMDVDLLEALNQEYATRRIVADAPKYDGRSLASAARRRVNWVHDAIDLRDKRLLEIGCGSGMETWGAAHNFGADSYGVDVSERESWATLRGVRVHLEMVDIGLTNPFDEDMFDRAMSFTVWEHVAHPYQLLEQLYRSLKPGGLAWLKVNLYPGPQASHRYREIFFPWPHLLFSDDVVNDWDAMHGRETKGCSWVNRLTWDAYQAHFARLGFIVRRASFQQVKLDLELYERFEHILGRYKMWDLVTDYFNVVLEKPTR